MRADSTGSPRRISWRRYGSRVLGVALLLLLGGCATRVPLAGLLPDSHRPHRARRPTAPPPVASAQPDTLSGGAPTASVPASP